MDKIREPIKIAALSFGINSTVLLNRLESMIIQIEQVSEDQNEDGSQSTKMRIISFREIVLSPNLVVRANDEHKPRTFEERAKMVASLIYLAVPELWQHDKKIATEINKWNYGPPTWGQIKQLDLWKLTKIKKTRMAEGNTPNHSNSFHRLYTLMKGLFHMDLNANETFKKLTWQWLAEKAEYEIIMILPL